MTNLIEDYLKGTKAVPFPANSQQEGEQYNAENEDGNNDEYSRKRREFDEPIPTREEYEANQREAEREIEYNSRQKELDDLEESASDYDGDQDAEFSGNYFEKPEESEKESLGDLIRAKYDSFSEKISNSAGSAAGAFVSGFNKKMDSFERGDPLIATKRPAKGRTIRYVSRPTRQNKNLSRPYVGGRFNDSLTLGANPYYPYPVNEGRQSFSSEPRDLYLPSGANNPYEGEFSGRKAFKREFSDEREKYDPFGYGWLSGDGFDNTGGFGSSLMGFGGDNSIFGGMSAGGTDTVFGNGAMFNAPRGKAKKEVNGFGLDMIIGNNGGMFNTIDPSARKTTTKRKSASTRKTTKKPATKRKVSTRKQSNNGFTLP